MTLYLIEGFENKEPNGRDLFRRISGTAAFGVGRTGGNCLRNDGDGQLIYETSNTLVTNPGSGIVLSMAAFSTVTAPLMSIRFKQAAGEPVWVLNISEGNIRLQDGYSGTVYATAPMLLFQEWFRMDMKVSPARFILRYNGNVVMDYARDPGSTLPVRGVTINMGYSYNNVRIDDLYLLSTDSEVGFNDFLGDVRIETLVPNGQGVSNEFTPSSGTSGDQWSLVDELPSSGVDYIQSSGPAQTSLFQFTNMVSQGDIIGLQVSAAAHKSDAGSANLEFVQDNGVDRQFSTPRGLSTETGYIQGPLWTKDASGGSLTASKINALQLGVRSNNDNL